MQKNKIRISALLLAVVLVISMLPGASAATLSDIKGHWAEEFINYGVSSGYISGYTDGTFLPNKTVTRAEFSKMVNSALGINHATSVSFTDLKASDWYYNEVRKAVSAGYISGYADNTFGAAKSITRQEAAVILSRVVTATDTISAVVYDDMSAIDAWAKDAVSTMAAKTYMLGDKNNKFRPKAALTRAEAAKVLYEVLKHEIVASSDQTFSADGSSYYNTIYPNNVTINDGVSTISFNSCRVLGTLTASGGPESTVNLADTGVNTLAASSASGESKVALTGSSFVKKTLVINGVTLSGSGFDTVSLDGENLSSDTVRLIGDFNAVNLSTSAVIKATGGTIKQFTIFDRATLMLQAANIDRFDLEADAKGSSVALSDGVTIKTAYIKDSATFTGNGTIQSAYETGGAVTYEKRPASVVGNNKPDEDEEKDDPKPDDKEEESGISLIPSFYPKTGASNISLEPTIRLTFEDTVFRSESRIQLTTSYIEDYAVELREGSLSGYEVPFTATLNSNKDVITISPDEYLEPDTRYYIVLVADRIYNEVGESNGRVYASFTTEEDDEGSYDYDEKSMIPTVTPSDGRTSVSQSSTIRLAFASKVYRATGSTLSESYVETNCVELREDNVNGTLVPFSAKLDSSKRIITITPDSRLKTNTTYYVIIPRDTLSDENHNTNSRFVSRFSTGSTINGSDIQFNPENGAEDVAVDPEITLSFDSPIYQYRGGAVTPRYLEETAITLRRGSASGQQVSFTADISSNKRMVTILPDETLDTNTTYYIRINNYALQYSTNRTIPQTTSNFRTTDGTLRVTDLSVGEASSSTADLYVTSNTTGNVTVKLSASGEAPLTQTVSVSAGRQTAMSFTGLSPNTDYTVVATVKDGAGRTSVEKKTTFRTTTLSFDLEASDITKNGATIEATFSTIGTLAISYKKAGDDTEHVALSNFIPNKVGTKSVSLRDLAEGTTYIVSATFTDASNNSTTRDITFTTDTTSTETSLKSLTINGSDGSYKVDIQPDKDTYEITIANTNYITITPVAADERSTITINRSIVKSGSTSSNISVSSNATAYYTSTVTVQVRSESGVTKTYTLKIRVAPSEK